MRWQFGRPDAGQRWVHLILANQFLQAPQVVNDNYTLPGPSYAFVKSKLQINTSCRNADAFRLVLRVTLIYVDADVRSQHLRNKLGSDQPRRDKSGGTQVGYCVDDESQPSL